MGDGRADRSRLRMSDTFADAFAAMAARPTRTLLTALGTVLGVGAFVSTTGLAATASAQVSSRFDALRATEIRVQDGVPDGSDPFPANVDASLGRLNGVVAAGVFFTLPGSVHPSVFPYDEAVASVPVVAASPGAVLASRPTLGTGRLFDGFDENRPERVALLGAAAAAALHVFRVDNGPSVFLDGKAYAVIGIIAAVARNDALLNAVIIPVGAANADFVAVTDREVIIDTLQGAAQLVGRQVPLALRPQDPGRLLVLVPPDPRSLRGQIEGDVKSLFYALSALALFVGTVAITNATLLNVLERRSEIGLRRALGATQWHVARQITSEAAVVGLFAGVSGATLGVLCVTGVALARGWAATMSLWPVAVAPGIGAVTGVIAGILPALKAARTPPAETLRS